MTIENAIKEVNLHESAIEDEAGESAVIPETQLESLMATNREVLYNVSEQMQERSAKLLSCRSRPSSIGKITTQELTSIGLLVSIFQQEAEAKCGKACGGLNLSLQGQSVMYIQSFHEEHRTKLSAILEKEQWKVAAEDMSHITSKLKAIPSLRKLFEKKMVENGMTNGEAEPAPAKKGTLVIEGEAFYLTPSFPAFLKILAEYCNLCSMLPSVTVELGLKAAELIKYEVFKICYTYSST